jgi:hypothetical protein
MLSPSILLLALSATGLAQTAAPEGYRKVYITSNVNPKFVMVPKAATSGSTVVVYVTALRWHCPAFLKGFQLSLEPWKPGALDLT